MITILPALIFFVGNTLAADNSVCSKGNIISCPERFRSQPVTSDIDTTEIQNAMNAAAKAIEVENSIRTNWLDARRAALALKNDPNADPNKLKQSLADFMNAANELRAAKKTTAEDCNKAISLAIQAYHLKPPTTDFSDQPDLAPNFARSGIHAWNPRFSETDHLDDETKTYRPRNNDELTSEARTTLGTAHASETDGWNGNISIYQNAFSPEQNAAEHLAGLILHETIHWVDIAGSGSVGNNPAERYGLEARAYKAQADFLEAISRSKLRHIKFDDARELDQTAQTFGNFATRYSAQSQYAEKYGLTFKQIEAAQKRGDPRFSHCPRSTG